jgi:hypothetical protein
LEGKDAVHLTRDAFQILMSLWGLIGCGLLWRHFAGTRHRVSYSVLCILLIVLPLLSGALGAMHRYVTIIFPLVAVWASIQWRYAVWRYVFGGLAVIQAVLFVFWIHNHPILT